MVADDGPDKNTELGPPTPADQVLFQTPILQGRGAVSIASNLAERTLAGRTGLANDRASDGATEANGWDGDPAQEPPDSPPAYSGPLIRVDSLPIPVLELEHLAKDIVPPNLIIVGGTAAMALEFAEAVGRRRNGQVRVISSVDLLPGDLAAVVCELEGQDVLLIADLDRIREETAEILEGLLSLHEVSEEDPSFPEPAARQMWVMVGKGPASRALRLNIKPFFIVARTWTGKVREPLRDWGAACVLSQLTKVCPRCAEEVKEAAKVCRFCGNEFARMPAPG